MICTIFLGVGWWGGGGWGVGGGGGVLSLSVFTNQLKYQKEKSLASNAAFNFWLSYFLWDPVYRIRENPALRTIQQATRHATSSSIELSALPPPLQQSDNDRVLYTNGTASTNNHHATLTQRGILRVLARSTRKRTHSQFTISTDKGLTSKWKSEVVYCICFATWGKGKNAYINDTLSIQNFQSKIKRY